MSFRPKFLPRKDRSEEFASFEVARPAARMATREDFAKPAALFLPKTVEPARRAGRVRADYRDSAKGEECTLQIPGACTRNPEHTIASHFPGQAAGKGMGIKSVDAAIAYACTACDAVVDGQAKLPPGWLRSDVLNRWHLGHLKTLVRMTDKGLI